MGNEKNLKPVRSTEEARERGRKGGVASGKSRREKRTLRENMELILSLPADEKMKKELSRLGVDEKYMDNAMIVTAALFKKASKGDLAAIKEIRDLTEENLLPLGAVQEDDPITAALKEELNDGIL